MKCGIFPLLAYLLFAPVSHAAQIKVGEWLSPKSHEKRAIQWGEVIQTGEGEIAQVVIFPAFVMKIHPRTRLTVVGSLLQKDGKQVLSRGAVRLLLGQIQGKLDHPKQTKQHFSILSRGAVIGVRGTEFTVEARPGKKAQLSVIEGNVSFQDLAEGTEKTISESKTDLSPPRSLDLLAAKEAWIRSGGAAVESQASRFRELSEKFKADLEKEMQALKDEAASVKQSMKDEYENFLNDE